MGTARIEIKRDALRLLRAYYQLPERERAAVLKDLEKAAKQHRSLQYTPQFQAFMSRALQASQDSLPLGPAD